MKMLPLLGKSAVETSEGKPEKLTGRDFNRTDASMCIEMYIYTHTDARTQTNTHIYTYIYSKSRCEQGVLEKVGFHHQGNRKHTK